MTILTVDSLLGIPKEHQTDIFTAMRACSNGQRLTVCLYFMSELPDHKHHLSDIERELRTIFPRALRSGQEPKDYKDFQASCVRFLFNTETAQVRGRQLPVHHRLWQNYSRGYWRNTELGNRTALQVLRRAGLIIQRSGTPLNSATDILPDVRRPYMEEGLSQLFVQ